MEPLSALKKYFGYDAFRPGQEAVVNHLLQGRDVLAVMPTGAGKSICYQIPALCMDGITLVVSPLISLMKDQVESLIQVGVPAAYLNSSLTERQFSLALRNAKLGKYKLIYVAPERLETDSFLSFARQAPISMITVDEAHCISQWGPEFRPSYLSIAQFARSLPRRPVVGAFTATATPQVREDILRQLQLDEPFQLVSGFDRPNLFWSVQHPRSKREGLLDLVRQHRQDSGIVYCSTRKTVEEVCQFLQERNFSATRYHAGLEPEERQVNQEQFVYGNIRIMVATNAFGMGIDKPDVRFVVHYNMPKDMESYYQESGRAGRDGDKAHCLLLYSPADVRTNQYLIESSAEDDETDEAQRALRIQQDLLRLSRMRDYCHTQRCLRGHILRYFGESAPDYCGACENCLSSYESVDITIDTQKILSCIKRTGERFGSTLITDILRGQRTERILQQGFDTLSTFGLLSHLSEDAVQQRIRWLLGQGYLRQDKTYFSLALEPKAREVLFGGKQLTAAFKLAPVQQLAAPETPVSADLFQRLRALRQRLAARSGVPAYVIFSDQTLREMCRRLPKDEGDLLQISGVGEQKLRKYGRDFLAAIAEWSQED